MNSYKTLALMTSLVMLTVAAPSTSRQTIDEILAKAGDMWHPVSNPNGVFPASGKKVDGGKAVIREYDIMVPTDEADLRQKRSASSYNTWPNGIIPYTITSDFTAEEKAVIQSAIDEYHLKTCLRFVPRTTEENYVEMYKGSGCSSYIGKISKVPQPLSLGPNCVWQSIVIHELMHALGAYHEHQRLDRDNYVTIHLENVKSGYENNFDIPSSQNAHSITYDYGSVMHYGKSTFASSSGLITIEPNDATYLDLIGRASTFSENDILLLSMMYGCGAPVTELPACTSVDTACSCELVGCGSLLNSACDTSTGMCVCKTGYVNQDGQCAKQYSCTTIADCDCLAEFGACNQFPNTACSLSSAKCECDFGYELVNGECVKPTIVVGVVVKNDGSGWSPPDSTLGDWKSVSGSDVSSSGISSNNKYLTCSGKGTKTVLTMDSPKMTTPGTWGIEFMWMGNSGTLTLTIITNKSSVVQTYKGSSSSFSPIALDFTTSDSIQLRFEGTGMNRKSWDLSLDNIKLYQKS